MTETKTARDFVPSHSQDVLAIPLALLNPSPHNPRETMGAEELEELERSIRTDGILQALSVRRIGEDQDFFEVVFGHRRRRAAQRAGLDSVPCRILENCDDAKALELAVAENRLRENVTAFDEATAVARLIELGRSPRQIGASLGISVGRVRRLANLAQLDEAWRAALDEGEYAATWTEEHLELVALVAPGLQEDLLEDLDPWNEPAPMLSTLRGQIREECQRLDLAIWKLDDDTLLPSRPSCDECEERSDVVGGLFEGVVDKSSGNAVCRNKECWAEKSEAFLMARYAAAMEEHGADLALVHDHKRSSGSSNRWSGSGKPWGSYDYDEVSGAKAKGSSPAFVATGRRQGNVIRVRIKRSGTTNPGAEGRQKRGAPKPKAGTLEELQYKRAHFENRLAAWTIDYVRDELDSLVDAELEAGKASNFVMDPIVLLKLVVEFGVNSWEEYEGEDELNFLAGHVAISGIAPKLVSQLMRSGFHDLSGKLELSVRLARLFLLLAPKDLEEKAEEAISKPRALLALEKKFEGDPTPPKDE